MEGRAAVAQPRRIQIPDGEQALAARLIQLDYAEISRRLNANLTDVLEPELSAISTSSPDGPWCGPALSEAIRRALLTMEQALKGTAQALPSEHWLSLLRRTPDEFFAAPRFDLAEPPMTTTVGELRTIAEAASAFSSRPPRSPEYSDIATGVTETPFRLSNEDIGALIEHVAVARIYKRLRSYLRMACKGVAFRRLPDGRIVPDPTEVQRRALWLYDARINQPQLGLSGLGLLPVLPGETAKTIQVPCESVTWSPPSAIPGCDVPSDSLVRVRFTLAPFFLGQLGDLQRRLDQLNTSLPKWNEIASLIIVLMAMPYWMKTLPNAWSGVSLHGNLRLGPQRLRRAIEGFLCASRDELVAILSEGVRSLTAETVVQTLLNTAPRLAPTALSPVTRDAGEVIAIDFVAAHEWLSESLDLPGGDKPANCRGEMFQDQVQHIIDASPWRPSSMLRGLRRQLRIDGEEITDIDAIGAKSGTLLLVDCLSLRKPAEVSEGEHRAVRQWRERAEEKATNWARKSEVLWHRREGDNFDFTSFDRVLAVVCVPGPVYVESPSASEEVVPGLRRICTVTEIARFLGVN